MRLGYDLSILRHPPGGTGRYAQQLLNAMVDSPARGTDEVVVLRGLPRLSRGRELLRRPRRLANFAADVGWLSIGSAWHAARSRLDAWFGPANVLPLALPRPAVVTIHDLNFLLYPETYDRAYARYAAWTYRAAVRRARRVLTDSHASRRLIIALLDAPPDRTKVVYPGVDHLPPAELNTLATDTEAGETLGIPPQPYALYVGQTEPHKNVGLLLDAWRLNVPRELHLVVCGPPGRDDERLRQTAARDDLRDRVHFVRVADDVGLAKLYSKAHLFLFPSLSEGFGFPPLEAMRLGVPTAVSDAASLPEVTAEGALHFDPCDPQALAELVRRLHEDDLLRQRLVVDGKTVAARYRWATTALATWQEVRHAVDG